MTILDMPAVPTARDAQIWINNNSLPGDTIRAHSDLPSAIDTNPKSSTYNTRVHLTLVGRRLTTENPITGPQYETACPAGLNDSQPIVELRAAQDPRTGGWYGGQIMGFTVRGGNQKHESSSRLAIQNQNGILVNPRLPYANLCNATLCTISETYFDGYAGPGGTLACTFEYTCRHAQLMHFDGAYMRKCVVRNCHRAYALEAYGAAVHVIHGLDISDNTFIGNPGYCDSPVAAGNGYDFGARFLRNKGEHWAWSHAWDFGGFASSSAEFANNNFTASARSGAPAMTIGNLHGGSIHDNTILASGAFAALHNCQYVDVWKNDGGPACTSQQKTV